MRKTVKRLFAVLLAVIMLVGAAPAAGLAGFADWLSVTAAAAKYSGTCGAKGYDLKWMLDTGTGELAVRGSGDMQNYRWINNAPWYPYIPHIKTVVIGSGVTSIGDGAFTGCTELKSVTLPDSVVNIGYNAFSGCTGLISLTIGNGVTSISELAFSGCKSLASVTLPDSVQTIGDYAFQYCVSLTDIKIPNGVTTIGREAFGYCTGLERIVFGNSLTDIGYAAFTVCVGLTGVVIPDSVVSIGDWAFHLCIGIEKVTFGNGVTRIGEGAFMLHLDQEDLEDWQSKYAAAIRAGDPEVEGISVEFVKKIINHTESSLTDVFCILRSEEEWNDVLIGQYNADLVNACFHYNEQFYLARVHGVSLTDLTLNYKKSAALKFTVIADPGITTYTVSYTSSDPKVVTVYNNGEVKALKKGTATITVTVTDDYGNTVQNTCTVTVKYTFAQMLIRIFLFGWIWY